MQEVIVNKRQILANGDGISIANKTTNEKDLLTLMLEAAKEENGKITDEEIKVTKEQNIDCSCLHMYCNVISYIK